MDDNKPANKDEGSWLARNALAGSVRALAGHFTVTYILPIGLPLMTALIGYVQGVSWMWVLVGGGLMFGGVTTGLVRFDDWRERRRVRDKLTFQRVLVGRGVRYGGVTLGMELASAASVPIEVQVREVRTRLKNVVPADSFPTRSTIVSPRGLVGFNDHAIDIGEPPKGGTLDGSIEVKLVYGPKGERLKHSLHIKKGVVVAFGATGTIAHFTSHDLV
jgi:hypothetical protein